MAGSDETSSSQNQGNFLELDELLSKCDGVIILYLEVMKGKRSRDLTTFGQSPEQSCRLSFAEAGSQQTRGRVCGNVQTGNREGCIHGHGPPPSGAHWQVVQVVVPLEVYYMLLDTMTQELQRHCLSKLEKCKNPNRGTPNCEKALIVLKHWRERETADSYLIHMLTTS